MKTQRLKMAVVVAVFVLGGTYLVGASRGRYGNADMNKLLQALPDYKHRTRHRNEAEERAWLERNWRFANLWLARKEKDIVPEIIPFLDDPDEDLRERAAKALGRLGDVRAEAPLQQKLEQVQQIQSSTNDEAGRMVPEQTLRLALGRIRARDLKGQAKLDKVAESVDLTYAGVARLAQLIQAQYKSENPDERRQAGEGQGAAVVLEFVDLLYAMGKNGENIENFEPTRLAFGPALAMKLKAATLPLEQEIQLILDYTAQPKGGAFDPSYLVGLGPRATEMIVQRLADMHRTPQQYNLNTRGAVGPTYLFDAAAMTGDPRVIPLLQQIVTDFKYGSTQWENNSHKTLENWTPAVQVYGSAQQARGDAERKSMFPKFPAY